MQKHILLVDNDAANLNRLAQALRQCDYRVSVAEGCHESLEIACNEKPDCIIFDVELHGVSGTILYSRLRRDARTRDIPAIVCTSVGPRPINFGTGVPVLRKDCSIDTLLATVRSAVA